MTRVLMIVPLPLGEEAVERRRGQLQHVKLGPGMEFDFRPVKAGPVHFMGPHDEIFMSSQFSKRSSRLRRKAMTRSASLPRAIPVWPNCARCSIFP